MGPWSVLYFVCIVLFGRFYLINLVLAVVAASYENEVQTSKMVSLDLKIIKPDFYSDYVNESETKENKI